MELEFVGYEIREPSIRLKKRIQCQLLSKIFVTFRLVNKETGEIKTQEVFFSDFNHD